MTNRNAYPNAMRCGTFLSPLLGVPLRPSTPRLSTLLSASQRFVFYFLSPLRSAALRNSSLLYSTQRFVCYNAPNRYAALGPSTLLSDLFVINASLRDETQRYSTPRNAFQLNDLFVYIASQLDNARRNATLLNST